MPACRCYDWSYQGFEIVRLENHLVQVDVVPRLGGKIIHFLHKGLDRQFLWKNPRLRLRELAIGAGYDDHFSGGWDELLPNDEAEEIGGEPWADHGELWTTPLDVEADGAGVTLTGILPINPLSYRRTMWLEDDEPVLRMETTVANTGRSGIEFLWKLHPALKISPGAEIIVPARTAIPVSPDFSRFGELERFDWPDGAMATGGLRADRVPELTGTTDFLYLTELADGVCSLAHKAENWRFAVEFPKDVFPTVWIFASFGGWRDHEVLILEPCTTWPKNLSESIPLGHAVKLVPGESITAEISVRAGAYHDNND